jgi:putative inorganic carbon (hco3(-)) transporter
MAFFLTLVYVALVIVRPQEYPGVVDLNLPILPVTLVLALIAWLMSPEKRFAEPQYALVGSFLLVCMISEIFNGWAGGALWEFTQFAPTVVAFVILANLTNSRKRVIAMFATLVLCSAVLALHGIDQVANGVGWTGIRLSQEEDGGGRIQYVGIFNDPNDLGLLFVAAVPFAFYLSGRSRGMMGLGRLFWIAMAGLLLYGTYLTNSRGAMLAIAAAFGFWLWRRRGLLVAALVGGAGLVGMMTLSARLQELDASEESAAGRIDAWYSGIQMFMHQPIFGVGAGQFTEHNSLTAHNSFVLALAETGYVGFTIWFGIVTYCFRMMWAIESHTPELREESDAAAWSEERKLGMTLLLSLCSLFTAAFFLSRTYIIVVYMIAALVVAQYAGASTRFPELPKFHIGSDVPRLLLTSVAGILALFVITRVLL